MADGSKIEWTDATWNVVIGCDKVSPGCDHCYAIRTAHRMQANPNPKIAAAYAGTEADGEWTGQVNLVEDRLELPLSWTRPRRIFVNAQSDLFHKDVPDEFIARVWAVMALAPRHTFQILTKRHGRMRSLLASPDFHASVSRKVRGHVTLRPLDGHGDEAARWPLPNVWLGVSVEDQQRADLRIPALLDTPASVRWLSCEPLLGPVDLSRYLDPERDCTCRVPLMEGAGQHSLGCECIAQPEVRWIVAGGESGPGARPMHPDWARTLRDQCVAAGIPFLFKQWGSHRPSAVGSIVRGGVRFPMVPASKRAAGRELDGRTWDEYPQEVSRG